MMKPSQAQSETATKILEIINQHDKLSRTDEQVALANDIARGVSEAGMTTRFALQKAIETKFPSHYSQVAKDKILDGVLQEFATA